MLKDFRERVQLWFPQPPLQGPPLPAILNVQWPYEWSVYRKAPKTLKSINSVYWDTTRRIMGLRVYKEDEVPSD